MRKPNLGILFKPASHDCNMACDYCYYRGVGALYPDVRRPRMSVEVFEAACAQYRALEPNELRVGWQGGEPTLMGLDFFRQAVAAETRCARRGDCWGNSLQTNGVLLNEEWCRFLAANRFLVGLSIDGPEPLNTMRRFPDGRPAYEATMRALDLLRKHGVEHNILVVISRANVDHPREVFAFLVENECCFSQFIPCTEPDGPSGHVSEHSITPEQYADFMIALFDAWLENDDPSYYVRRIDNWLHMFFGLPPECCEYRDDCSNLLTVEWNGDVYPCDFYVEPRYLLGNVRQATLGRMMQGRVFREFVRAAERKPPICRSCEWLSYCHAGCFRHRRKLGIPPDGEPYLCRAKKRIFPHVVGKLGEVLALPAYGTLHGFMQRLRSDVESGRFGPASKPAA
jgi:uncharacterized protein